MKLYDVPRRTKVRLISETQVPPGALAIQEQEIYEFINIDGMYSFCKNKNGDVVHLPAWAEVEIVNE